VWDNITICYCTTYVVSERVGYVCSLQGGNVVLSLFRAEKPCVGIFKSVCYRVCREWGDRNVYGCWFLVRLRKIAFGNMVLGSFRWLFAAKSLRMWNLSVVLK